MNTLDTFDPNGVGLDNGAYFGLPFTPDEARLVLISAPWDVTVSYGTGTSEAPDAIIEASMQLDLCDALSPGAWRRGIATADIDYSLLETSQRLRSDAERVIRHLEEGGSVADDAVCRKIRRVNEGCVQMNENIRAQARAWLAQGKLVGLVGGDHSTPYGLVQALGEAVDARVYLVTDYPSPEDALEQAAADGAQVVFTTTVPLIFACRKLAPKYPGVRFLNCSVDMPYPGVRTYYSRIYEAKFLLGALAGTLAEDARIGYVADAPVFGTPAAINAFALGAQLTRPDAQILLRWSCCEQEPAAALAAEGLGMICAHDLKRPGQENGWRGLCRVEDGKPRREALPVRNWGEIYIRLARSILRGGWDELSAAGAVNYWWGFASGAVDVQLAPSVPDGPRELLRVLREALVHGELTPFHRRITDQEGTLRNDGEQWFSPETILRMDWLCSNVTGRIPDYEELLPMAQPMVRLLGVYRDALQPKKRGPLL